MTHMQMIKQAVRLFPRTDYTDAQAVRHARREWINSVILLRCRPEGSRWILDQPIARVQ